MSLNHWMSVLYDSCLPSPYCHTHCCPFPLFLPPLRSGIWYFMQQTIETASLPLFSPITMFINSLMEQVFILIGTAVRAGYHRTQVRHSFWPHRAYVPARGESKSTYGILSSKTLQNNPRSFVFWTEFTTHTHTHPCPTANSYVEALHLDIGPLRR